MAAKNLEIYKCDICGIMVEVTHGGAGKLSCCGEVMKVLTENTTDAATEKHVPVLEHVEGGVKVSVGSVAHPMIEEHWIEWIEVIDGDGKAYRQFLNPEQAPEAFFPVQGDNLIAREYCNLHGLWKAEG